MRLAPGFISEIIRQLRARGVIPGSSSGGGGPVAAEDVSFVPAGGISATNAQAALMELDQEKASTVALALKADANHQHGFADVPGLQTALDGKQPALGFTPEQAGTAAAAVAAHVADSDPHTQYATNAELTSGLAGKLDTSHAGAGGTAHANVVAGGAAGFMTGADKTKLDGIATGATANATDAQLRDRTTHTGSQAISTVTGLQAALDGKAASSHSHGVADLTATGTKDATTFLRGDNTWAVPPSGSGGASLVSAFLTATQANSTVTPAVLTGHTFTLNPGQALLLVGQLVCTAAATTTGFALGIRAAQAAGAGGNVVGSWHGQVALQDAAAASQLFDSDVYNVAAGSNTLKEVLGTASTAGNNGATFTATFKNNGTSGTATVTVEFRSEVAASAVTAQIGTGCVGVKG